MLRSLIPVRRLVPLGMVAFLIGTEAAAVAGADDPAETIAQEEASAAPAANLARHPPVTVPLPRDMGLGLEVDTGDGGLVASSVAPACPADEAGLQRGDVITQLDGKPLRSMPLLIAARLQVQRGARPSLTLTVRRAKAVREVTFEAAEEAAEPAGEELRLAADGGLGGELEDGGGFVRIAAVEPGGPAAGAGLTPGDAIAYVDCRAVGRTSEVEKLVAEVAGGERNRALLVVNRADESARLVTVLPSPHGPRTPTAATSSKEREAAEDDEETSDAGSQKSESTQMTAESASSRGDGPHARLGSLQVTFARRVSGDHRATEPSRVFSETDRAIFMAFRNGGSRQVRADVDVYAVDVEGFERNARYWTGAWAQVPPGRRHSLRFDSPEGGLVPGKYRFEIRAAGTRQSTVVEVEPEHPFALREEEAELEAGHNIALHALGGRIEEASQWEIEGWSARHLNDGLTWIRSPDDTDRCVNCGWSSREGDRRPEIVIGFHEQREADIAAVLVDTRRFLFQHRRFDEQLSFLPRSVAVHVSSQSVTSGFERVATARLRRDLQRQIIPLPEGTRGKFLKLEVLENFGPSNVVIAEVEVIERDSAKRSIVEDAEIDSRQSVRHRGS